MHQDAEKDEVQTDTTSDDENGQSPPTSVDESDIEMDGDGEPSEGGSSEADKDDNEEQECNHDIAFSDHIKAQLPITHTTACHLQV